MQALIFVCKQNNKDTAATGLPRTDFNIIRGGWEWAQKDKNNIFQIDWEDC